MQRKPGWRRDIAIAGVFFLAVLIPRIPAFFRSVLDWDESLYFIMAEQWRAGHLPYTVVWDNKPVGIYAIFAAFQAVFGDRIFAIRLASVLFVTAGALLVHKITRRVIGRDLAGADQAALWAGGIFIVCALSNDGLSANTELFMAAFTAGAVLCVLSTEVFGGRAIAQGALAGLLLGCAFMIKYVSVFEAPAVFLLLLWEHRQGGWARAGEAMIIAAGLPLAAAIFLYWHAGQMEVWWADAVASNFRRVSVAVPGALAHALRTQIFRWGPVFCAPVALLAWAPGRAVRAAKTGFSTALDVYPLFLALWLAGGGIGVAVAKSYYQHYFLQILPVLSVTCGWLIQQAATRMEAWPRWRVRLAVLAAVLLPAWAAVGAVRGTLYADGPYLMARDLTPLVAAGAGIYVFDYQPVMYSLTGARLPTRYVLPSVLTKNFLPPVAGVDPVAEVARILAGRPEFILCSRHPSDQDELIPAVYSELNADLAAHYRLWRSYHDARVYRLEGD